MEKRDNCKESKDLDGRRYNVILSNLTHLHYVGKSERLLRTANDLRDKCMLEIAKFNVTI